MKLSYLVSVVLISAAGVVGQASDVGVSLEGFGKTPQQRVDLAKQLGARWYRPAPVLLGDARSECADCEAAKAAGMKVALVIRNSASAGQASSAVTDTAGFKQRVRGVLERNKPELLIVEDEPDNQKTSFRGSPVEYGAELKAACEVSHEMKIPCANGGFTSLGTAAVAIDQRWKVDQIDAAKFANAMEITRARGKDAFTVFGKELSTGKTELDAIVGAAGKFLADHRDDINRVRDLSATASESGIDYFNFHWFELQPDVLPKLVDILHELTKRPLMTDEVGQRTERPFETGEKIKVLLNNGVRPVIWSGVDSKDGVIGLVDNKGKLRLTSAAFTREAEKDK